MILIDTNIAIDLRDGNAATNAAVSQLVSVPALSIVSHIELEGGVHRDPALLAMRRALMDSLLARFEVLPLTEADVLAYGQIVSINGFDRRRILDRLIGAQCLTRHASLITRNPRDFQEIPGIHLIPW